MAFLRAVKDKSRDDYQVIFRPGTFDFWLARAKPGEDEKTGARFQESQYFDLRRLLGMPLL